MVTTKIRYKMPETNSSSSHSLAIYSNNPSFPQRTIKLDSFGRAIIPDYHQDFGWGWDYIENSGLKACYVISCIIGLYSGRYKVFKEHVDRFEKIIKDYTGATDVLYEWTKKAAKGSKRYRYNFINYAPSVDHQSIEEMYRDISITDESMRDFIFSNRSDLIIGSEDVPPLDIILKKSKDTEYKVQVDLYLSDTETRTIYYQEWPGGRKVRLDIMDFASYFAFSIKENSFFERRINWSYYGSNSSEGEEDTLYEEPLLFAEEKEIRFYKNKELNNYEVLDFLSKRKKKIDIYGSETDYKLIKFEIKRNDNV